MYKESKVNKKYTKLGKSTIHAFDEGQAHENRASTREGPATDKGGLVGRREEIRVGKDDVGGFLIMRGDELDRRGGIA